MGVVLNGVPCTYAIPIHNRDHLLKMSAFFKGVLSPFYYKTGTMGRIGSTKLVLPKWLSYGTLNRVIRVGRLQRIPFTFKFYAEVNFREIRKRKSVFIPVFCYFHFFAISNIQLDPTYLLFK